MKSLLSILGLMAALIVLACAQRFSPPRLQQPRPFPFPGHGPFNPNAKPLPRFRFRRDAGQLHAHSDIVGGRYSSSSLDFEKKLFENGHGSITGYGGVQHSADSRRPQGHAGVRGVFDFGGQGRTLSDDERLFNSIMEKRRRENKH